MLAKLPTIQLLKVLRINFRKFAAHAHKDDFIDIEHIFSNYVKIIYFQQTYAQWAEILPYIEVYLLQQGLLNMFQMELHSVVRANVNAKLYIYI